MQSTNVTAKNFLKNTNNNSNNHHQPVPLKCPYGNRSESFLPEYRTDAAYRCYFCCFSVCCGCFADADRQGKVLPQVKLAHPNSHNNINTMLSNHHRNNNNNHNDDDEVDNENDDESKFSIFLNKNHNKSSSLLCPLSCWPSFLRCPQCNNDKNSLELHVSPPFEWICETWAGEDFRSTKIVSSSNVTRKQTDGGASHDKVRPLYHSVRDEFLRRRKTAIAGKIPQISSCFLGIVASAAVPRKLQVDQDDEENHHQKENKKNNVHDDGEVVRAFSKPPESKNNNSSTTTLFTSNVNNNTSSGELQPINNNNNEVIDVDEMMLNDDDNMKGNNNDDNKKNNQQQRRKLKAATDYRQNPRLVTNYTLNPIELVKFPDATAGETTTTTTNTNNNNNLRSNNNNNTFQQQHQQSFMSYFNNSASSFLLPGGGNLLNHNLKNNLPHHHFMNNNNKLNNNDQTLNSSSTITSRRGREDEEWQHSMPFSCKVPPIRAAYFLVRGVNTELLIRSLAAGNRVHAASRGACCQEGESFAYFLHNMDGLETELIWFGVPHRLEATGAAPTRDSGQILEDSVPIARVTAPPSALSSVRPQILHVPRGSGFSELRLMQGRRLIGRLGDADSDSDSSDDDEAGRMIYHDRPPLLTVTILLDTTLEKKKIKKGKAASKKENEDDDALSTTGQEYFFDYDPLVGGAPTMTRISLTTENKKRKKDSVIKTKIKTETESMLLKDQATGETSEPNRVFSKHEAANIRTAIDFLLAGTNVAIFGLGSKRHILSAISRSDKLASFAIHIIDGAQIRDAASMTTALSAAAAAASISSSQNTSNNDQQQQQMFSSATSTTTSNSFSTAVTAANLLPGGAASSAFVVSRLAERGLLQHYVDFLRRQIERYDQEWEFQFYLKEVRRAHRRAKKLARLPLANSNNNNNNTTNDSSSKKNNNNTNNNGFFDCVQHSFYPITTTPGAKTMDNATNLTLSTFKNPIMGEKNTHGGILTEQEEIFLSLRRNRTMQGRNHQQITMMTMNHSKNNTTTNQKNQHQQQQRFLSAGEGPTPFVHPLLRTPAFQQQKVLGVAAGGGNSSSSTNNALLHHSYDTTYNSNNDGVLFLNHQIKIFKPPEAATLENESMTDLLFFGQRTVPLPNLPREKECTLAAIDNHAGKICIGSMKSENIRKIFGPASSSSIQGGANLSIPELLPIINNENNNTFLSSAKSGNNNFYANRRRRRRNNNFYGSDDDDEDDSLEEDDDDDETFVDDESEQQEEDPTTTLLKTTVDTTPLRHLVVIINGDWIPPSILAKIAEVVSPSFSVASATHSTSTSKCGRAGRIVTLTCFDDTNFLRRCAMSAEISAFRFKLLECHTMAPYLVESTVLSDAFTKFLDATAVMETDMMNNSNNNSKKTTKKKNNTNNSKKNDDEDDEDENENGENDENDDENNNNMMTMNKKKPQQQQQKSTTTGNNKNTSASATSTNNAQQQAQLLRNRSGGASTSISERRRQEIQRAIQSLPQAYRPRINLLARNQISIGTNTVANVNLLVNMINNTPGQMLMTGDQMRTMIQELSSNHLVFWNRSKYEVKFMYPDVLVELTKE